MMSLKPASYGKSAILTASASLAPFAPDTAGFARKTALPNN